MLWALSELFITRPLCKLSSPRPLLLLCGVLLFWLLLCIWTSVTSHFPLSSFTCFSDHYRYELFIRSLFSCQIYYVFLFRFDDGFRTPSWLDFISLFPPELCTGKCFFPSRAVIRFPIAYAIIVPLARRHNVFINFYCWCRPMLIATVCNMSLTTSIWDLQHASYILHSHFVTSWFYNHELIFVVTFWSVILSPFLCTYLRSRMSIFSSICAKPLRGYSIMYTKFFFIAVFENV